MVFHDSVELVFGFSLIVFAAYQACGFLRVIFFTILVLHESVIFYFKGTLGGI